MAHSQSIHQALVCAIYHHDVTTHVWLACQCPEPEQLSILVDILWRIVYRIERNLGGALLRFNFYSSQGKLA